MTGVAVLIILVAMASNWLFRSLLLGALRSRHPREFAELGHPSSRQLASLFPRYRELQLRFWKHLWGGKFFLIKDRLVSGFAWGALIADVALVAGVIVFLWSPGK
jgi:hypothetical protein